MCCKLHKGNGSELWQERGITSKLTRECDIKITGNRGDPPFVGIDGCLGCYQHRALKWGIHETHKDRVCSHYNEAVSGYEFISQDASGSVEGDQETIIVHGPPLSQGDILDASRYDGFQSGRLVLSGSKLVELRLGRPIFCGSHPGEFGSGRGGSQLRGSNLGRVQLRIASTATEESQLHSHSFERREEEVKNEDAASNTPLPLYKMLEVANQLRVVATLRAC